MPTPVLDRVFEHLTKALITGDFDLYRSVIRLPVRVEPRDGQPYELHCDADLETDFNLYRDSIALHGVTDIYRRILHQEATEQGQQIVTVETHLLEHANRIVPPFETRLTFFRHADGWRIGLVQSSLGHINWTLGKAKITPDGEFVDVPPPAKQE